MLKLNTSRVIFTNDPHTYTLDGKELQGITGILSRQIFKDKYFDVSEEVLARAAERGSLIHERCRAYDNLGVIACEEVEAYAKIKEEFGLETIANEYTVSDEVNYASNIDLVAHRKGDKENEVYLADYKTTSHLDVEYLSWQLSIYKYFFELNNPDVKVVGLLGIWLPLSKYGKPRAQIISEKPQEEVIKLLEADAKGESYTPPIVSMPSDVLVLTQRCTDVLVRMKEIEEEQSAIREALYQAMVKYDVKKWETDAFVCTRTLDTKQKKWDTKSLESDMPELADKYKKETMVRGSIRIKLK